MTNRQRQILESLRRGAKIEWNISGCLFQRRRLRDETFDALVATGELALVCLKGKYNTRMRMHYLVHRDKVQEVAGGREILDLVVPFTGFGKRSEQGDQ